VIIVGLGILLAGGMLALLLRRWPGLAQVLGCLTNIGGCAVVLGGALWHGTATQAWSWSLPYASLSLGCDRITLYFVLIMCIVCGCGALYARAYMAADPRACTHWLWYNWLSASMLVVVLARNAILFMLGWEVMTLASFFLVLHDSDQASTRRAGWIYLVATHVGSACLLAMFVLLSHGTGQYDFAAFAHGPLSAAQGTAVFVLALVGFGVKAGFVPLHVWLPEAHPAAPSHVSAVMSGVMIKTGIYGLIRILMFLGPPPPWWGVTLICIGVVSGIFGVLFALAQHDLKRLLAYHSVENIGIVALGLGLGMLGVSYNQPAVALAGFAGALLHVINHAVFKGLLFLGAGAVAHATGTRTIDHLGGLLKGMPWTGVAFLIGAAAIAGLPPLNGFVSELLIYVGALRGVLAQPMGLVIPALGVALGLALIGGLAVACFAKAFGIIFLGEPRSEHARHAHEVGLAMRLPMLFLAAACVGIGLAAPLVCRCMVGAVGSITGLAPAVVANAGASLATTMSFLVVGSILLLAVTGAAIVLRRRLLAGRGVGLALTWDCGYAAPTARMQYTASSFAQPLTEQFSPVLQTETHVELPAESLPARATFHSHTPDVIMRHVYLPIVARIVRMARAARVIQQGLVQVYVLYMVVALLALFIWTFW